MKKFREVLERIRDFCKEEGYMFLVEFYSDSLKENTTYTRYTTYKIRILDFSSRDCEMRETATIYVKTFYENVNQSELDRKCEVYTFRREDWEIEHLVYTLNYEE